MPKLTLEEVAGIIEAEKDIRNVICPIHIKTVSEFMGRLNALSRAEIIELGAALNKLYSHCQVLRSVELNPG